MVDLSKSKVTEINSNLIFIYDARCNDYHASVPSEKTWEYLSQILVKAFRLQEAEDTVLVFDNYSGC